MPVKFYYITQSRQRRYINIPNALCGYIKERDVDQIAAGKRRQTGLEPSPVAVGKSARYLAEQRKSGNHE